MLVDGFEVVTKFDERTYERYEFQFYIDGELYKGDFYEGEINWLNPNPKQTISESELQSLEHEIFGLLQQHNIRGTMGTAEMEARDDI
mgnify:CR=1 FL=1